MTVDFAWGRSPKLRVVSIRWKGPWNERKIRSQFERLDRWAKSKRVRTGRWIFLEPADRTWEVALELHGPAAPPAGIRARTLRASRLARVVFDPEKVAPRVVYHAMTDWLRGRRKDKEIRSVTSTREVYPGNPWKDPKAWSQTEVQFLVRP
jgi:hypothetical protein